MRLIRGVEIGGSYSVVFKKRSNDEVFATLAITRMHAVAHEGG